MPLMPLFLDQWSSTKLRQNLCILEPSTFLHTANCKEGKDDCQKNAVQCLGETSHGSTVFQNNAVQVSSKAQRQCGLEIFCSGFAFHCFCLRMASSLEGPTRKKKRLYYSINILMNVLKMLSTVHVLVPSVYFPPHQSVFNVSLAHCAQERKINACAGISPC